MFCLMCVFNCQSGILITSRVYWQRISSIILLSCNFPWVSHIIMLPENAPRKIWSPLWSVLSFIHPSQFCSGYISATTCLNSMKLYGKFYENNEMSLLSTHYIAMIFHGVIALWFSYTSFCVPIIAPGEHPLVSPISCFSRHKIYKVHTLSPQTWQFTNKSTEYCIPQKLTPMKNND